MKIAFLISDISLSRGGERTTSVLANSLSIENDIVIVSLYKENDENFFTINDNIKQINVNNKRINNVWKNKIQLKYREIKHLATLIKQKDIDLWIGVGTYCSILLGALNFLNRNQKYIAWEHSNYEAASKKWMNLRKFFFKRLDAIVCLTEGEDRFYKRISNKVVVIPNMVPFEVSKGAVRTSKTIISVGALEEEKGFDLLITAFAHIVDQIDWNLKIIGSGSLRNDLLGLISAKQITSRITIEEPTREIANQYLSASMYVLPSRREGFPMVLLEASECGLPCIAFDCPTGPAHLIKHQVNGLLVPAEDINLLAQSMFLLINSDVLSTQLALAAKEEVKKYYPQQILKSWYSLFKQLNN